MTARGWLTLVVLLAIAIAVGLIVQQVAVAIALGAVAGLAGRAVSNAQHDAPDTDAHRASTERLHELNRRNRDA